MAKINLSGRLIPNDWAEMYNKWGYQQGYFSPSAVREAVDSLEDGEELLIEVNSVGGMVDGAAEIYSLIQSAAASGHQTTAHIQSVAASAASYMCLACDRVEIALPAQMMIHNASVWCDGNKEAHERTAEVLAVTDNAILDVYEKKCAGKCSRETLKRLMDKETWISAADAVDMGLCDGIIGGESTENQPFGLVASVTNNIIRAMDVLPPITDLLERENQWKRAAADELAVERRRFE